MVVKDNKVKLDKQRANRFIFLAGEGTPLCGDLHLSSAVRAGPTALRGPVRAPPRCPPEVFGGGGLVSLRGHILLLSLIYQHFRVLKRVPPLLLPYYPCGQ